MKKLITIIILALMCCLHLNPASADPSEPATQDFHPSDADASTLHEVFQNSSGDFIIDFQTLETKYPSEQSILTGSGILWNDSFGGFYMACSCALDSDTCAGSSSCQWVLGTPDSNGVRSPWCAGMCDSSGDSCSPFCAFTRLDDVGFQNQIVDHLLDGGTFNTGNGN